MSVANRNYKREGIRNFKKFINLTQTFFLSSVGLDIIEGRRLGVHLWDVETEDKYIDCFCSAGSFNVGRRNPEIVNVLEDALESWDMGDYLFPSGPKVALAEKLVAVAPPGLQHVMFCVGGGEANDSALKMARGITGRQEVISLAKAYHGHTGFALSAIGKPIYRDFFEPLLEGFTQEPVINDLETVDRLAGNDTAAIILELVQGESGIFCATQEFVEGLRRICDERGITLIFDEVQTGLGRTGKMFCCQHYDVEPDIMTVAKSLSGSLYPISAVIYNQRIRDFMEENPEVMVSTSGGSDLGCIVGSASLDYLVKNNIPEHAAQMGDYIGDAIVELSRKHEGLIKEVRRKGLMIGLEYTHDFMGPLMSLFLGKNGVMAFFSSNNLKVMRLMPPIVITRQEAEQLIMALDRSMASAKRASQLVEFADDLPLVGRIIGIPEIQIFAIMVAKTLRKIIPKK